MNLQDLASIADLVAGLGVVVSLVYVGYSIRQTSKQIEQNSRNLVASMYHATNDAFLRWFALLAEDEQLAALWRRALKGDPLEEAEVTRVHSLISMLFLAYENNYKQLQLGAVDRDSLEIGKADIATLLSRRVVQDWWGGQGARILTPQFRSTIERLVAGVRASEGPGAAPTPP
jgi:hypothetical protein